MIFRTLFGGPRAPSSSTLNPMSDPAPVKVEGPQTEADWLSNLTCECAGPWALGDRTILETRGREEVFRRQVRCQVCGLPGEYLFVAPVGAYELDEDEDEDEARAHHYLFVHRILPQIFFDNPDGLIDVMLGPSGHRRLVDLWREVGERETPSEAIPSDGLQLTSAEVGGRFGVLITFPPARFVPEAWFAVLLPPLDDEAERYFLLEKTDPRQRSEDGGEWAVLCEWLEGGKRRNHERTFTPTAETMLVEVGDQLLEEQRRLASGASRAVASWDLAGKGDPLDLMFAENFRLQPCFFAFHLLPMAVLGDEPLVAGEDSAKWKFNVERAWTEAARLCAAAGEPELPPAECPQASIRTSGAGPLFVVEMASAFSAPEPLFLAVQAEEPRTIYLLESAGERSDDVFVTSIDGQGQHGILGTLAEASLKAFLLAFEGGRAPPKVLTETMPPSLKQLISYAAVAHQFKNLTGA